MRRITFAPANVALDEAAPLEVVFANTDGRTVEIALIGYSIPPTDVLRGGKSTGSWYHDAGSGLLVLVESDGASYPTWKVVP